MKYLVLRQSFKFNKTSNIKTLSNKLKNKDIIHIKTNN